MPCSGTTSPTGNPILQRLQHSSGKSASDTMPNSYESWAWTRKHAINSSNNSWPTLHPIHRVTHLLTEPPSAPSGLAAARWDFELDRLVHNGEEAM